MTDADVLSPNERPALLWEVVCLPLLGIFLTLLPQARLSGSMLAMSPKQTLDAIPPGPSEGFMQRLNRQVIWLVGPGRQPDPAITRDWLALLQKSHALTQVKGPMDTDNQQT